MYSFKQKNVTRSYKLLLQDKLRAVTEQTENATTFLNNRLEQFTKRVRQILELKDDKYLSLFRKLSNELESYSEMLQLFMLQASLEGSEEESDSSEDEEPVNLQQKRCSTSSQKENKSFSFSNSRENINLKTCENVDFQKCLEGTISQHTYPEKSIQQNYVKEKVNEHSYLKNNVVELKYSAENLRERRYSDETKHQVYNPENENLSKYPEDNISHICHEDDGESIIEEDFHSLSSDNAQNTNSCTFSNSQSHKSNNELVSENECLSNISVSENSFYCSISSNIYGSSTFHQKNKSNLSIPESVEAKNKCSLEIPKSSLVIYPTDIEVPSRFSATLSHIIDPGNFWIQLENSYGSKQLSFLKSEYAHLDNLTSIVKDSYCLAPYKSTKFYYRAQSLSDGNCGEDVVKVFFIDHGSTQEVSLCDLRPLPSSAYDISAQAVNCYLYGIVPANGSWSCECTDRLKDFENFCIETSVICYTSLYGVKLVAKTSADLGEDFSVDIAQALCLDHLAVLYDEFPSCDVSDSQSCKSQLPTSMCNKTDLSLKLSGSYDINAISNDSGVSVTSYKSNQVSDKRNEIFHKASSDYMTSVAAKDILPNNQNLLDFQPDVPMQDHILFESYETLNDLKNSSEVLKSNNTSILSSCCLLCRNKNFCLHLKVPSPSLLFVGKDMVIVMLSHIVSLEEFYVNMAMENIGNLDDLREQMTCTYEAENDMQQIKISDLAENMFCAGRFEEDNHWYRVKIVRIGPEDMKKNQVLGQYIDYGNTVTIQCCDLRPLTPEFAKHPSFAIKCSLAGISPVKDERSGEIGCWEEDAINTFKRLTSFDRCLTAQICNELRSSQKDTYPVLLWDALDSTELLINESLAEQKVAVFDYSLVNSSVCSKNKEIPNIDIDSWNPMTEEYYDVDNNYGVNDEDIEVITTGYRAKDEKYTCKYFSLHGRCPRGSKCQYEHLPLLESGVTHDQEEVYCLDTVPILSKAVNNILVQVSAIITPSHFYVILPFGCKTVDDIDNLVCKGSSYDEITNSEAKALFSAIDKHYSNKPFNENTAIALSCGTIVVAKRKWDDKWHRGRIVDVIDINKPAKIFFVDSGDHEWVPRKCIRTILPQFLHTPFQAVQCSLYGIEPIKSGKESSWSSEAVHCFKDVVSGEILLAEIIHRFNQVFHVSLRKTSKNDHRSVAQLLVFAGCAQYGEVTHEVAHSEKKETLYVPG